jgi:hypothetical protein
MTVSAGYSQVVTLYSDCGYGGKVKILSPGRYSLDQIRFGSNQLSAIRVGQGLKAILYDNPTPGQGQKIRLTSDVSCLGSDWNDRAMSIVIEADNTGGNNGYQDQQQPVYPSYGSGAQVIIFEDCGLKGNNVNLVPGRYDSRAMGLRNDVISSIRVPSGYSITVFKEGGFRGESMTFYANVYCLDGRMNDQISSIIVNGPGGNYNNSPSYNNNDNNSGNKVTIYDQCNYGGQAVPLNAGRYNYNNMGLQNDRISSIRVPRGYKVIAYASKDFQGPTATFTYDESCLNGEWNNQISSLIVEGPGGGNYNSNNNNYNNNNYNSNQSGNYPPGSSSYNGATVYVASWFRGEHAVYGEGRYDLRNSSLKTNISSIALQPGYRIIVYEDFGFRGRSQTFTSSVANLSGLGWNDNIRSFEVTRSY